nr:hypothetical protein [Tanacetum cinerariifolium]
MASFDYRLNPLYPIKECSSYGALYTMDYCCSDGSPGDKIIYDLDKTPDLSQRPPHNCPKCGHPVDGHYCQGCALLRKKFKEDLFTYCEENGILQDSSKPSNDNTNVVNALQEPFVVKRAPVKIPHKVLHKSTTIVVTGDHYGYNCPPKVLVVSNPKPLHNQNNDKLPQTVPSFDPICYSKDGNSFTYDSTSNLVHDSPNVFNPPLQPPTYSYEFCGNDAYYDQDCSLQVSFTYDPKPLYINTLSWDRPAVCYYDDDDEDYIIAVTPILLTKEPDNSLSMGDEHLDTILATESDEFIKYSVENLVPILSESEGIPDNMCDAPFHDNSPPLGILKDQFNLEVMEIVIPKVGGTDDDILLTIKDDILREKLLNVNLFIANIEALKDNPTPYFDFMTKYSSTSLNSLLEETNTFDNSLPEYETFYFDLEEISSGSITTRSNISLPKYEAFYDDHVKEISSGSTTTHSDSSLYDFFIFDLSINPLPPADRSDFFKFVDELTHIISPPEYDCFCFKNEPNSGDFTMDVVEDTFPTREPRVHVHNALSTHPNRQLDLDFILSSESLFAYVVWIFFFFSHIQLLLNIFYPSRMKIPFLIPASAVIISLLSCQMYIIEVELS